MKKIISWWLAFSLSFLVACGGGGGGGSTDTQDPPIVNTSPVVDLDFDNCTLVGVVNPNSSNTTAWFEWGTISNLTTYTSSPIQSLGSGSVAQTVSVSLTGLTPGTMYYYRIVATNAVGSSKGKILSFVTYSQPLVSTGAATAVGTSSATFNGSVNPGGLVSDAWFERGTDPNLTTFNITPIQSLGASSISQTVTHQQTGLASGTTYYYRISASNAAGVTNGNVQSFSTSIPLPSVTTESITHVGAYVAVPEGTVNPHGFDTDAWFDWGPDPNLLTFMSTDSYPAGSGSAYVPVSRILTDLNPGDTYFYRIVASNSGGDVAGAILNFTTLTSVAGSFWAKTFGGADSDVVRAMVPTADGGYFVVGYSFSFSYDCWALKLSGSGDVQWQKSYSAGRPYSAQQTTDGGFIIAGQTDNDLLYVLKLSSSGAVSWYKLYGGGFDGARSIQQTSDGGYVVAGFTWTYAGSLNDIWVLKLANDGTVQWDKSYDIFNTYNSAVSIQQTLDGGYIVAGRLQYTFGNSQVWVLKLNSDGSINWQKIYGTIYSEYSRKILQTSDGGYILLVFNSQDVNDRMWLLKLDSSGNIVWQKGYGGQSNGSIALTADGGYVLAGARLLDEGIYSGAMAAKLASNGDIQWQKTYGDTGNSSIASIHQLQDGSFALAGHTYHYGVADAEFWLADFWVLKIKGDGTLPPLGEDTNITPTTLNLVTFSSSSVGLSFQATGQNSAVSSTNTNAIVQNQAP